MNQLQSFDTFKDNIFASLSKIDIYASIDDVLNSELLSFSLLWIYDFIKMSEVNKLSV